MSLRRLRLLAGLNESIADTSETNAEIESRLDQLPSEMRTHVLDALDVLKSAGKPVTLSDWADTIRSINGDGEMPMGEVLKAAVQQFPMVVAKVAAKTYQWITEKPTAATTVSDQIRSNVGLTSQAFAIMRAMGSFTEQELKNRLSASGNVPAQVVDGFVDHLMQNFSSMLVKNGDRYSVKDEQPADRDTTMQSFRDIVANAKPE
jgi:hypothetical protein